MKDENMDLSHLTKEQKKVIVDRGTERPFSGEHLESRGDGVYTCAACGAELFKSDHKYESGSGWPAFEDVAKDGVVELTPDHSFGMTRVSAECAKCGGHLGHYFEDGMSQREKPQYCINSLSLDFKKHPETPGTPKE